MDTKTIGARAIQVLCERMAKMPVYELPCMKAELSELGDAHKEYKEFLAQEPADVLRRYQMGINACKAPSSS